MTVGADLPASHFVNIEYQDKGAAPTFISGARYIMIYLTKLGGKQFMLNEDQIESISQNPDTIVVLSNGHNYIVQESMDEIMDEIIKFNRNSRRIPSRRDNSD